MRSISKNRLPPAIFMTEPGRISDIDNILAALPKGFGIIYRHFGEEERFKRANYYMRLAKRGRLISLFSMDRYLAQTIPFDGQHWPEAWSRHAIYRSDPRQLKSVSAHSPKSVRRALRAGFDMVIVSCIFPSRSTSACLPLGAVRWRLLARMYSRLNPSAQLYGLGGINAMNVGRIASAGGIAGIDGFAIFSSQCDK